MKSYQTWFPPFCKPAILLYITILNHLAITKAFDIVNHLGNATDHAALLAIKSQLSSHPAGVLSSWNESLHHCYWRGVTCNPKHKRVTVLDLNSMGVSGTISPYIGNLSFLTAIELYNNSLVGLIPPELGRLFRLRTLGLYNNSLAGEIPANLSACTNLQILAVGVNNLQGKLPMEFRGLSKLTFLSTHLNRFTGPLFEVISNCTSIESISALGNSFTGTIPTDIGKMQHLTQLALASNTLHGTIPTSLLNCSALQVIDFGGNNLHGQVPQNIGLQLPNLVWFRLFNNSFSGPFPYSLLNLTNLEYLGLYSNNFVGKVPNDFGRFQKLWFFALGRNHFEGDVNFIGSLRNCSKLEWIHVGGNELTGTLLPESVSHLSPDLEWLSVKFNKIRGGIPAGVTNLINLQTVEFNGNEFTGSIPRGLQNLKYLQTLDISSNRLTGTIPDIFGNLSLLSRVFLSDNRLEGSIPPSLGSCPSLLRLNLSSNNLNGTLVNKLFKGSAKFISVDLSSNLLEGSIPSEISMQQKLAEFLVFRNKLSGVIPNSLSECLALQRLDIHSNFFQGGIPTSLKSLGSLQTVDFSRNNLSGTIPGYFSNFSLVMLNLSYNNFEGTVPTTGVFANVSAVVLDGNNKLCGGIPKLHFPICIEQKGGKPKGKMSRTRKLIIAIVCPLLGVLIIATSLYFYLTAHKKTRVTVSSGSTKESFMKVSYDMLLKATNGFSSENLLGAGSFGSVFRGSLNGETIAVKVLNLQTRGASKSFIAECKTLQNVRHRNLVGIITACSSIDFQQNDFKALVYEFMPNGNLDGWLYEEAKKLTLIQRVDIAIHVAHALNYLHHECETPIVHCDLKPSNILLDDDMIAHVADFGLAKFLSQPRHLNQSSSMGVLGTVGYVAPEYGLGSESSSEGDIYSYGVLLLELITGKRPTDHIFEQGQNLQMYVEAALSDNIMLIVDPRLEDQGIDENVDDIRAIETNVKQRVECISSVLGVGVACSKHLPQDRMKITDAINRLRPARDNLCMSGQRGQFR